MLTNRDIAAWAGDRHVIRADADAVPGWRLPEAHKALLTDVGVPLVEHLIEAVEFQADANPALATASGGLLYQLTRNHHGNLVPGLTWSFGAEPDTGKVYYVLPEGQAWFANTSIEHWLHTLHHYGRHVHQSPILSDPDDHEDEALDELHRLAEELKQIDPPAFVGYHGYIWAEFLERWLW